MDIVAAFDQKAADWDCVGNVKKDNAGRDHAVERRVAPQIQQSQDRHDDAADKMRSERNVHPRIDVAEEFGKGEPAVASEGPTESALPGMTGDQAPDSCRYEQTLQHNGSSFASESLIEKCQYRYKCEGGLEVCKAGHAEEQADGVEPRGNESNGNSTHDSDRDHFFGAMNFLGKVSGTIKASKGVIGIDQPDNESNAICGPSSIVHKISKDKLGILMRWRLRGDNDQDHEERYERSEQGYLSDYG